jgi:hypothetical protein
LLLWRVIMAGNALRFARMSTTAVFFYQGLIIASWASRIPQIKAASGLSDGLFGLALLGAPLTSIAVMRPAARFIAKHGSKKLIRVSVTANVAAMILLAIARNGASLAFAGGLRLSRRGAGYWHECPGSTNRASLRPTPDD